MATMSQIKGIDIDIHWTSLILFSYIVLACAPLWSIFFSWKVVSAEYVVSAFYAMVLFFNILLHELGHGIVNNKIGIKTPKIIFFFIGAGAHTDDNFSTSGQEVKSASAGLLVSIALMAFWYGLYFAVKKLWNLDYMNSVTQTFIFFTAYFNWYIVLVNTIPAFPTDGGRILRAILWVILKDQVKATIWAVRISITIIIGIVIATLLFNPGFHFVFWVLLACVFVALAAFLELKVVKTGKKESEILAEYKKRLPSLLFKKF